MKHTFEEKLQIVSQVKNGKPIRHLACAHHIHEKMILEWVHKYDLLGESGLHKRPNIRATPEVKEEIVRQVIEKMIPLSHIVLQYGVSRTTLESWVRIARSEGYQALHHQKKRGRPPKDMGRPKKREPQTELEKLQAENARLRAENALLKKVKALVREREAREHLSGRQPSKD